MSFQTVEQEIAGTKITLETGRLARQASGSVVARIGDTMVLAAVSSGTELLQSDFFPLTVEYIEKTYAAGKIPGGFIKREGRPSEKEILSARLVDRPIRPLFPDGYRNEVQVICTVISADELYNADVMAITAASTALCLSNMPFPEPVAAVRVGLFEMRLKVFPTLSETEGGRLDLVVAGTENSIMMVEGGAWEVGEDVLVDAILLAHNEIKKIVAMQKKLIAKVDPQLKNFTPMEVNAELKADVDILVKDRIHEPSFNGDKKVRYAGVKKLLDEVQTACRKIPGVREENRGDFP